MLSAKRLVTGFVALLALCVYAALPGVEAQPQASSDLIYVPVMVSDAKGAPITTLKEADFQVLEDTKEQKLTYFSGAGEPVTVSVILNLSASGPVKAPGQKDRASTDIYAAVDRMREVQGAGAAADQVPFDSDSIFGVMGKSMDALAKQTNPRKALIVVADGYIASQMSATNVPLPKAQIEASKVSTFPIHFLHVVTQLPAPAFTEASTFATGYYLEQIVSFSGGEMIVGQIDNTLAKIAANFRDSLKNQYVLGFKSANTAKDGKWRKLTVKVAASAGKVKVDTKSRYFVPKTWCTSLGFSR